MYRPGAREEIREARGWYERRVHGLGRRFLDELDETMARVVDHPLMYEAIERGGESRRALLTRFPYAIVYEPQSDGTIVVLACMHLRQERDEWLPPTR